MVNLKMWDFTLFKNFRVTEFWAVGPDPFWVRLTRMWIRLTCQQSLPNSDFWVGPESFWHIFQGYIDPDIGQVLRDPGPVSLVNYFDTGVLFFRVQSQITEGLVCFHHQKRVGLHNYSDIFINIVTLFIYTISHSFFNYLLIQFIINTLMICLYNYPEGCFCSWAKTFPNLSQV